jgi:hypothetical protein
MAEGAETVVYPPRTARLGLALAIAVVAACQRDEVAHFRVPKQAAAPAALAASAVMPPSAEGGGLRWTLPAGWKEAPGGGPMRYATLTAPVAGKVEVTVIRLPGPAGGELANVNRWRSQLGLPPLGEGDLAGARQVLTTVAGPLNVYDFTSAGAKKARTIAGFAELQGESWFLKLTGDAEAVQKARAGFLELLGSLHP